LPALPGPRKTEKRPQIKLALSRGFAVSGRIFDGVTRDGPPKAFGVDPWLISCTLSGHPIGGFAESLEPSVDERLASTFQHLNAFQIFQLLLQIVGHERLNQWVYVSFNHVRQIVER
jgi:hypothetical protein